MNLKAIEDFLKQKRKQNGRVYFPFSKINENDFVAITNVGAYGSSLSSNYNTRPLVAEILINKNKLRYIRKRQNLLKLINT